MLRPLIATLVALALAPVAAYGQASPAPLSGEGENFEIIGTHNIEEGQGTDLEVHGDYAYVAFFGGMVIVDISDPRNPKRVGTLECGGGGHDIALNPDATIAYLASDGNFADCGEGQGTAIVDVSDKTRPQVLSSITTPVGSHTVTVDGHVLSSNNYADSNVYFFDVTDPRNPKPLAQTTTPGPSAFHDSFFDHRPDGRVLLYGASGEGHDIFDVTDPSKPTHLQRVTDPEVTFSHQLEPNHDRTVLIASDEWQGGGTAGACGKVPGAAAIDPVPGPGLAADLGAYSFYSAGPDGLFAGGSPAGDKLGTFNIPFEAPQTGGCTSHVFWQSPDSDRLIGAWYVHGTRIVDFSDPESPQEIGWFEAEGADTWAAKPHRGLIFTGDLARGMDVLRYTGEGWPATAGPAEVQRLRWHGFAKVSPDTTRPPMAPTTRSYGRFKGTTRVKVPGRRGKRRRLTISFIDNGGAVVGRGRVRKPAGRHVRLRFSGVAESGRYRFVVRAGTRVLKRGRFTVPATGGSLPSGRVMRVRVR
jgi:hypothetical protein